VASVRRPPAVRAAARRPVAVSFTGPRSVALVEEDVPALRPGTVRVRTLFSGISSGTEMTAYRGSNVYLTKRWDPAQRMFTAGGRSFEYPVVGWGYSEVGEVVEVADDVDDLVGELDRLRVGDVVHGIWGHRSEAVLPAEAVAGRRIPPGVDPLVGVFARVGAIALNGVLAADLHLGETVVVFGQGVIGLLATRLAALSGARVIAVDGLAPRRELAARLGAAVTLDPAGDVAEAVRRSAPEGADVAIELSGSYRALHEAVRSTAPGGRVVAAGFYQGEGAGLHLGEEFHHNRIQIVASQIGGVPTGLAGRWTTSRLHRVFMDLVLEGRVDVAPLLSHVVPCDDVEEAYRLLDEDPAATLEMVLDFRSGPHRADDVERAS
jgi:2-desacetyl-2-hydroxyethyl bacteriochlorophyllide A dehydrogenase